MAVRTKAAKINDLTDAVFYTHPDHGDPGGGEAIIAVL
jgi:hypothetical protein